MHRENTGDRRNESGLGRWVGLAWSKMKDQPHAVLEAGAKTIWRILKRGHGDYQQGKFPLDLEVRLSLTVFRKQKSLASETNERLKVLAVTEQGWPPRRDQTCWRSRIRLRPNGGECGVEWGPGHKGELASDSSGDLLFFLRRMQKEVN